MADRPSPRYLLVGELLRPHGVRGEMRMRVLTDYPERLGEIETIYLGAGPEAAALRPIKIEKVRMHQGYALITFKKIEDRTEADALRGLFVMIDIEDAVPLEDDEVYLYQLIGMSVHTEDGKILGTLSDVLETGANDVYIIDSPQYGELLVPVTDDTLIDTDTDQNIITMRLPEGLLPS